MNLFTLSKTDTDKIHQSHQLSKWWTFGRYFCFGCFFLQKMCHSFFFRGPVKKKLLKSPRLFFFGWIFGGISPQPRWLCIASSCVLGGFKAGNSWPALRSSWAKLMEGESLLVPQNQLWVGWRKKNRCIFCVFLGGFVCFGFCWCCFYCEGVCLAWFLSCCLLCDFNVVKNHDQQFGGESIFYPKIQGPSTSRGFYFRWNHRKTFSSCLVHRWPQRWNTLWKSGKTTGLIHDGKSKGTSPNANLPQELAGLIMVLLTIIVP